MNMFKYNIKKQVSQLVSVVALYRNEVLIAASAAQTQAQRCFYEKK